MSADRREYMKDYYLKKKAKKAAEARGPVLLKRVEEDQNQAEDHQSVSFLEEDQLETYLIENWDKTKIGEDYEIINRQFSTPVGRIDILAASKDKSSYLVIELKKNKANDMVLGQVLRYMGFVESKIASPDQEVFGAIVAFSSDKNLEMAVSVTPNVTIFSYQISASIRDGQMKSEPRWHQKDKRIMEQFNELVAKNEEISQLKSEINKLSTPTLPKVPHSTVAIPQLGEQSPPPVNEYESMAPYFFTTALVIMIAITTVFLVKEQATFYELRGDGANYAIFTATLTEIAALSLSFFATRFRRPALLLILIPTIAASLFVIYLGLDRKGRGEEVEARTTAILEAEVKGLEDRAATLEGKPLERVQAKLADKREELRASLSIVGSSIEIWVLAGLRVLAIFWNIAFASLIAFIWRSHGS